MKVVAKLSWVEPKLQLLTSLLLFMVKRLYIFSHWLLLFLFFHRNVPFNFILNTGDSFFMPGGTALWNVDKSCFRCNVDLECMLIGGVKKVSAEEKETRLWMACSWESGRSLCENCHSGKKSPRARAGSDDALVGYVSVCSRKLLTTFCPPYYQIKLVPAQKTLEVPVD